MSSMNILGYKANNNTHTQNANNKAQAWIFWKQDWLHTNDLTENSILAEGGTGNSWQGILGTRSFHSAATVRTGCVWLFSEQPNCTVALCCQGFFLCDWGWLVIGCHRCLEWRVQPQLHWRRLWKNTNVNEMVTRQIETFTVI